MYVCIIFLFLCVYILSPTILQRSESHVPFFSQFSSAAPSSTCWVLATSSQPIWLSTSKHPSSSQNSSAGGFPGGPVVKNPSPMQDTRVRSLVWEDPTCQGATKPGHHNCWACALEPGSCNHWNHMLLKPERPRACASPEKSPQWETRSLQPESSPHS